MRGWLLHLFIHFVLYVLSPSLPLFLPSLLSDRSWTRANSGICDLFCYSFKRCISLLSVPRTVYHLFHPGLNNLSHLRACIAIMLDIKGSVVCWVAQLPSHTLIPPGCFVLRFSPQFNAEGKKKQLYLMVKWTQIVETDDRCNGEVVDNCGWKQKIWSYFCFCLCAWRNVEFLICMCVVVHSLCRGVYACTPVKKWLNCCDPKRDRQMFMFTLTE